MAKKKTGGAAKSAKETPLMQQYYGLKAKHPDAILLFRVGDFYETFGEDAVIAAEVLGITLTKRANGAASHIELAGFPHHALDVYLPKFTQAGRRVAICEQLEDPKKTKTLVKRGITELITPGTTLHDKTIDQNSNNFLACVHFHQDKVGIALTDLSTGEFVLTEGNAAYADKVLQSLRPAEVLHSKACQKVFQAHFGESFYSYLLDDWLFGYDYAFERLTTHFKTPSLKGFGVEGQKLGISAAGVILHYLNENKHTNLSHISSLKRLEPDEHMWLDRFTIRNLELLYPSHESGKALINVLDHTLTPMGSRLLKSWMVLPLKEVTAIERRQRTVAHLIAEQDLTDELKTQVKQIGDLERLISRVALYRANPREIGHLKRSLDAVARIKEVAESASSEELAFLAEQLNACSTLRTRIESTLSDDPPVNLNKGKVIREGVSAELDDLRQVAFAGKDYLLQLQEREQERTGISSLKLGFNNVFGYYLEVRNTHKDKVPEEWIRKQTLVSAERYVTQELKEYEEKILGAEERLLVLESELFQNLILDISEFIKPIQQNSAVVAQLDCLMSFGDTAVRYGYCQPSLDDSLQLEIKEGRHPVIERTLPVEEEYIPNDVYLDNDTQQLIILTGPNMAGKSALLRQTALIVLMAQMGSFVPAQEARIGVVDKIFTRVGASDNLSSGESTFMVEMTETASILNNFSRRSLILLDEIGRGTSTYDGVSIAWAISEYLHEHPYRPKTIFATHYHELNEIAESHDRARNFHVSVKEVHGKIIFMRKLLPGGSEHSFGIHVAQLAGVPQAVVGRANEVLTVLEDQKDDIQHKDKLKQVAAPKDMQLSFFEYNDPVAGKLKEALQELDINTTTPMEALMKLNYLKSLVKKEKA